MQNVGKNIQMLFYKSDLDEEGSLAVQNVNLLPEKSYYSNKSLVDDKKSKELNETKTVKTDSKIRKSQIKSQKEIEDEKAKNHYDDVKKEFCDARKEFKAECQDNPLYENGTFHQPWKLFAK